MLDLSLIFDPGNTCIHLSLDRSVLTFWTLSKLLYDNRQTDLDLHCWKIKFDFVTARYMYRI